MNARFLTQALAAAGCAFAAKPAWAAAHADPPLRAADINHDGRVSEHEHAAGSREMFGRMDANHDRPR